MIEFRVPEFKVPYFSAMYDIEQGRFFDHVECYTHEKILQMINNHDTVIFNLTRDQYHGVLRNQTVKKIKYELDRKGFNNIFYITNEIEHIESSDDRIFFCPIWFYSKYLDYKSNNYEIKTHRNHTLSCLNRFPFPHKVYVYFKLMSENYDNKNLISFYGLKDPYNLQRQMDINDLWDIPVSIKNMIVNSGFLKEKCCVPEDNLWNNDHSILHPAFSDTYLNIITESTHCTTFFTEKTCKPLCAGQLFLSPNAKNNVTALRHLGFEVFDSELDSHSYDSEDNFITRIDKMFLLLSKIYTDIPDIYYKNFDKIKYNREYFLSDKFIDNLLKPLKQRELLA